FHFVHADSGYTANIVVIVNHTPISTTRKISRVHINGLRSEVNTKPINVATAMICANGKSYAKPNVRRWGFMYETSDQTRIPIQGRRTQTGTEPKRPIVTMRSRAPIRVDSPRLAAAREPPPTVRRDTVSCTPDSAPAGAPGCLDTTEDGAECWRCGRTGTWPAGP